MSSQLKTDLNLSLFRCTEMTDRICTNSMDAVPCVDNGIEGNRDPLMATQGSRTVVVRIAYLSGALSMAMTCAVQAGCRNLCQYFPLDLAR
jgi:hypothetical protein